MRIPVIVAVVLAATGIAAAHGSLQPVDVEQAPGTGPGGSLPVAATSADARRDAWARHQQMARESPVANLAWRAVGPRLQGGRIETVAVAPGRTSTIYAGAGIGGVWKSINNGTTWTPIFDKEATTSIGSIAVAPSEPNVVWVGTGEVLMARSSYAGFGVYKSLDAGATWTNMGLTDTHHIAQVLVHPKDPNRVWVAAIGRLYAENEERGVFRTNDGGRTWQRTLYVNPRTGAIDLTLDPSNPDVLYASMWDRSRKAWGHTPNGPGSGAYKSMDAAWQRASIGCKCGSHRSRHRALQSQSCLRACRQLQSSRPAAGRRPRPWWYPGAGPDRRGSVSV